LDKTASSFNSRSEDFRIDLDSKVSRVVADFVFIPAKYPDGVALRICKSSERRARFTQLKEEIWACTVWHADYSRTHQSRCRSL